MQYCFEPSVHHFKLYKKDLDVVVTFLFSFTYGIGPTILKSINFDFSFVFFEFKNGEISYLNLSFWGV